MEDLTTNLDRCKEFVQEILNERQLSDYYSGSRIERGFYDLQKVVTNPYKIASLIVDQLILSL